MPVIDLRQKNKDRRPQCSAPVSIETSAPFSQYEALRAKRTAARGFDPAKCSKSSSYTLDGEPYCLVHAGQIALDKLMEQN